VKAVVWHGVGDIRLDDVDDPRIQEPTDAIIRITRSAICGTDLHMVRGTTPDMVEGTVLGHEAVGVVEEVGVDAEEPGSRTDEQWKPGDAPRQALDWAVELAAKAGSIGIIGVYPSGFNDFPIGQAMNKNLTMRMGNCNHRRYLPRLLDLVLTGAVDPTAFITQHEKPTSAVDAYRSFDLREDGWLKTVLDVA